MTAAARALPRGEAGLAVRWAAGLRPPLRLADGRALRVVFPGVPGGASGPDFRGAILDAGGDYLQGDVELHVRASGWRQHGHHTDPAYGGVVLHVVEEDDVGALVTIGAAGRAIPVLVTPAPWRGGFPPPFVPPCALQTALERDTAGAMTRLGRRRMRAKAARAAALVASAGAGQAVYGLLLETAGGSANRAAFGSLARRLPLAALVEAANLSAAARPLALSAELKGAAANLALRRAGLRPMASPGRRLEASARLIARLWPAGAGPAWPSGLKPGLRAATLQAPGLGRQLAIEIVVNAVVPVALACEAWTEEEASATLEALPSPGTYGRLKRLEGWLQADGGRPFNSAAALQGALLLHADYCTKGACGRCPLSG